MSLICHFPISTTQNEKKKSIIRAKLVNNNEFSQPLCLLFHSYMALYSLLHVQCYFSFMGFSENVESLSGFSKKLLVFKVLQILSKAETEKI